MVLVYILIGILILFVIYVAFLFVCSLFVNPKREYENNSRFYRALLYGATAGALKLLRIKVHVEGISKLPEDKNVLFVGNHRSNFDPIIEWQIFKKWDIAFISKASNFKIPIFGRFIRKCCFMAIDREDTKKALVTINKAAELLKKGEVSIGIYPEGTRNRTEELLPFHNAVFHIAKKANAPIAVMAISGTDEIHKNVIRRRSDIYLKIVDVIPAEDVKNMRTVFIGERVKNDLENSLYKNEL